MTRINANQIVGTGFPTDEGRRLAEVLLEQQLDWTQIEIDLTDCDSALLISAFFNSFLQTVSERDSEKMPLARQIDWKLEFPFQQNNVEEWMKDFEPFIAH